MIDLEKIHRLRGPLEDLLRESTFLQNPYTPPAVRESTKELPPPASLAASELKPLQGSAARVLSFSHMPDLYATLPADEARAAQKEMQEWVSIWCCGQPLKKNGPGHVWYDFFADVVPHTDRHRKRWDKAWEPIPGP